MLVKTFAVEEHYPLLYFQKQMKPMNYQMVQYEIDNNKWRIKLMTSLIYGLHRDNSPAWVLKI